VKSTNYFNTFIAISEDCPAAGGEVPPTKGEKSVVQLQYEMIAGAPYAYTQDDVLFEVFALRSGVDAADKRQAREAFFAKGQPCLRASPLGKRYGWGVHSDASGRVAIYGAESDTYQRLTHDPGVTQLKAMRSKRG
jgi:Family of unknown function (DUF6157)